jgi:ubiquinone/menaquinone biosynthesis C-methylase UbiE
VDARLQRRVQRYGWDLAAADYEPLWGAQLAGVRATLLAQAGLRPGERVIDIACGTGLVTHGAARAVGPGGSVVGVDLSGEMVAAAAQRAQGQGVPNVNFARMDAERLECADAGFDVALCALGLMYLPEPERALREMRRVLRPGGRMVSAVWGERAHCGWAALFGIVQDEVASDVCPLFFRLGQRDTLTRLCIDAGFASVETQRLASTLVYADVDEACEAAFVGGPVALAWSRFGADVRERVRRRYLEAIAPWREGAAYHVPGEFVVVSAKLAGCACPTSLPHASAA